MYIECVPGHDTDRPPRKIGCRGVIYDVRSDYRSQWVINKPFGTFDIKL